MQKITPFLWFDQNAEEAANFYVEVFKNSKIAEVSYYAEGTPNLGGTVMSVSFSLDGHEFIALNGGPDFKFTPAISFMVSCKDQKEIDYYWEKLSASPQDEQCGWLKDQFGLSWQIVPENLQELLQDPDPQKAQKLMEEFLKMKKIEISKLESI